MHLFDSCSAQSPANREVAWDAKHTDARVLRVVSPTTSEFEQHLLIDISGGSRLLVR